MDFKCLTNPDNPVKFAQSFDFTQRVLSNRLENGFWNITELFTEEGRKMREECKYISEFAYQIIENRRNDPEALKNTKIFINSKNENKKKFTNKELKNVIRNINIAGRYFIKKKKKFFILVYIS